MLYYPFFFINSSVSIPVANTLRCFFSGGGGESGEDGSVGKVLAVEHQDLSLIPRICIKSVYNGILGM